MCSFYPYTLLGEGSLVSRLAVSLGTRLGRRYSKTVQRTPLGQSVLLAGCNPLTLMGEKASLNRNMAYLYRPTAMTSSIPCTYEY